MAVCNYKKSTAQQEEGTTMNHQISEKELDTKLEALAQQFGFETLQARNSDDLDFHEVSVWGLREMLAAAYTAGLKDAANGVSGVAETTGVFQAPHLHPRRMAAGGYGCDETRGPRPGRGRLHQGRSGPRMLRGSPPDRLTPSPRSQG